MSICSFNIYQVYWFYKNWQQIKRREGSDIWPLPRAIFGIFFCHDCFKALAKHGAEVSGRSNLAAGTLATGWVIITLLQWLPDLLTLLSLFSVAFMVPVQAYANTINSAVDPGHDSNSRFTPTNWIVIVLGSLMLAISIFSEFAPQ